jgi:hypothetical protein
VWEISSGKLLKRDGWICINTDGAAKGNMIVGCGGVLRGEHGAWLCNFLFFWNLNSGSSTC